MINLPGERLLECIELAHELFVAGNLTARLGLAELHLQVAKLGPHRVPRQRAEHVNVQPAEQVVRLVLDSAREKALGFDLDRLTLQVVRLNLDLFGSTNFRVDRRKTETTLFILDGRVLLDDLRVDENLLLFRLLRVTSDVENETGGGIWAARPIPLRTSGEHLTTCPLSLSSIGLLGGLIRGMGNGSEARGNSTACHDSVIISTSRQSSGRQGDWRDPGRPPDLTKPPRPWIRAFLNLSSAREESFSSFGLFSGQSLSFSGTTSSAPGRPSSAEDSPGVATSTGQRGPSWLWLPTRRWGLCPEHLNLDVSLVT